MIKRFFIENFCSIKDRIDLSFEASKIDDDTFYNNVFPYKDTNIQKVVSFYGMNASGKTTIIRAFAALRELIIPTPALPYFPFEFDEETKHKPISIGIEFSQTNKNDAPTYRYFVSYNKDFILKEKFEKLVSQKPTLLYERGFDEDGSITQITVNISKLEVHVSGITATDKVYDGNNVMTVVLTNAVFDNKFIIFLKLYKIS